VAELALGVSNLTGAKYYTQAFACVSGAVSAIYPEAGRAVTGSVRLHF
jgi:iron complex outermembrane recepter protein